jgi:hypothetical protein
MAKPPISGQVFCIAGDFRVALAKKNKRYVFVVFKSGRCQYRPWCVPVPSSRRFVECDLGDEDGTSTVRAVLKRLIRVGVSHLGIYNVKKGKGLGGPLM